METRINWNEGEGAIVATYTGSGSGTLRLNSSTANEGPDREQVIQVAAKDAPLDIEVTVKQPGKREVMATQGAGNPEFHTKDGSRFAVLK